MTFDPTRHLNTQALTKLGREGLCWWLDELKGMVPIEMRHWLFARQSIVVDFNTHGVHITSIQDEVSTPIVNIEYQANKTPEALAEKIKGHIPSGDMAITPRFSGIQVLRRTLHIPAVRKSLLRDLLKHEISRLSPLPSDQVQFHYQVLERNKSSNVIEIEVFIFERTVFNFYAAVCQALKLSPAHYEIKLDANRPMIIKIPARQRFSTKIFLNRFRIPLLAVLATSLAIITLSLGPLRQENFAKSIDQEIQTLRSGANKAVDLRNQINVAEYSSQFLIKKKEKNLAISVLADVTRMLPDSSWAFYFSISPNEIRLRGYSSDAAALIPIFSTLPQFTQAKFMAPLTRSTLDDFERFDLALSRKEQATQ